MTRNAFDWLVIASQWLLEAGTASVCEVDSKEASNWMSWYVVMEGELGQVTLSLDSSGDPLLTWDCWHAADYESGDESSRHDVQFVGEQLPTWRQLCRRLDLYGIRCSPSIRSTM